MNLLIKMNNGDGFHVLMESCDYETFINDMREADENTLLNFGGILFNYKNISTIKYEEETK